MTKTEYASFSLVLEKDGKVIFSSDKKGIRPLVECVMRYKGTVTEAKLYDKVIGLAAARIVSYSGMIREVETLLASTKAAALLKEQNMPLVARHTVNVILNQRKTDACPMEQKAMQY